MLTRLKCNYTMTEIQRERIKERARQIRLNIERLKIKNRKAKQFT